MPRAEITQNGGERGETELRESHSQSRKFSESLGPRPDEPPWGIQLEFTGCFPLSLNQGLKFPGLQVCISTVILHWGVRVMYVLTILSKLGRIGAHANFHHMQHKLLISPAALAFITCSTCESN